MSAEPPAPHHHAKDAIWVFSDAAPSGGYALAVQYGEDGIFYPMDPTAYALHVIAAVTGAMYDAAILNQALHLGLGPAELAALIVPLREARAPLDQAVTYPLTFTPIVAGRNVQPYVIVGTVGGAPITQWTYAETLGHALQVLTVAVTTDFDNGYRDRLVDSVELDPGQASAAVSGLSQFMRPFIVAGDQDEDCAEVP